MCGACDNQERVCPDGHTQPKHHGDVFRAYVIPCDICGQPTAIRKKEQHP
jgi:hypothetical protein